MKIHKLARNALAAIFVAALSFSVVNAAKADFIIAAPKRSVAGAVLFNYTLDGIRKAFDDMRTIVSAKAELSAEIALARKEFWSKIDQPSGYEERYARYMKALFAKDMYYFLTFFPEGKGGRLSELLTRMGGHVDGGISDGGALVAFDNWIDDLRFFNGATEGKLATSTPQRIVDSLTQPAAVKSYNTYRMIRDRAEFVNAGYGAYFDAEAKKFYDKLATTVTRTVSRRDDGIIWYSYSAAPEFFSPDIEEPMDQFFWVRHDMFGDPYKRIPSPKNLVNTLKRVEITPAFHAWSFNGNSNKDGMPIFVPYTDNGDRGQFMPKYFEKKYGAQRNFPRLIECIYGTAGRFKKVLAWYKTVPDFSDAEDPKKFAPFVAIGALDKCPADFRM